MIDSGSSSKDFLCELVLLPQLTEGNQRRAGDEAAPGTVARIEWGAMHRAPERHQVAAMTTTWRGTPPASAGLRSKLLGKEAAAASCLMPRRPRLVGLAEFMLSAHRRERWSGEWVAEWQEVLGRSFPASLTFLTGLLARLGLALAWVLHVQKRRRMA